MSSRLLTRAALVAVVAALGAPGTASAAFSVVSSPNAFSGDNILNGVSASSPTDAWAVGSLCCSIRNSGTGALTEHWDGSAWTVVLGPDARFRDETLNAVADISPSDAWAVGRVHQSGYGGGTPMILHWNGSSWQTIAPPSGATGELLAVSSDNLGGAWAVGRMARNEADTGVPPGTRTLAMHWDGTGWSAVSTPNTDDQNSLMGVAATGPAAVTAVGSFEDRTGGGAVLRTLGVRWDGSNW